MMNSIPAPYRRYLRVLGFDAPPSGIEGLCEAVRRHLERVPFENVSKLLLFGREGAGRPVRLGEFLDGIERRDLGGTCYSSNPFLTALLRALGYDADLLGADMSAPDVHTSIRVRLDGAEYHLDVGYAAPFREPMRLDRLPWAIRQGSFRYVLDRAARDGAYEMAIFNAAERVHGYVVHGPPRSARFFRPIVLRSFDPGQTFMANLRITRFLQDGAAELRNQKLVRYRHGAREETVLRGAAELRAAVADELRLPRCPVLEAVDVLERITGKPFFTGAAWSYAY